MVVLGFFPPKIKVKLNVLVLLKSQGVTEPLAVIIQLL